MRVRTQQNQDGIAKNIILVIIGVVIILGFVVWAVFGPKNSNNNNPQPSKSAQEAKATASACEKVYHDKDLCKFVGNFNLAGAYSATFTTKDEDGKVVHTSYKSDGKGNSIVQAATSEVVNYKGATYVKAAGSKTWIKYGSTNNSNSSDDTSLTKNLKFDNPTDANEKPDQTFTKKGTEKCGNLTCFKYEVAEKDDTPQTIWFDTQDYRLRKISVSDADDGSTEINIEYGSVTISEPTPVTDMSDGNNPSVAPSSDALRQLAQ